MDMTILEDLGLTSGEIKIYLALSELGSSVAGPIIEKTELQNSVVHRALHTLIAKGLVTYFIEGKGKTYQISDPHTFLSYLDEKRNKFEAIIPELLKRRNASKEKKDAVTFKGKKGITQMYTQLLNSGGKEYNTFGGGKNVTYEVMGETWWRNLHVRRIALKLRSRQVFDASIKSYGKSLNNLPYTKIRFLPQEFQQLTETVIVGDYFAVAIFTEDPYGILIHDRRAAEGYRKHFKLLWRSAKD